MAIDDNPPAFAGPGAARIWCQRNFFHAAAFLGFLSFCKKWEWSELRSFICTCRRIQRGNHALCKLWNLGIFDVEIPCGVRLHFARIHFFIGHFAICERANEACHALQAAPLSFTIDFVKTDSSFNDSVSFHSAEITACVAFAPILRKNGTLARSTIHEILVLVTLPLLRFVFVHLPFALSHLCFPN
jgi:hypothetical protein